MSRRETARTLAESHANVDPDIQLVVRVLSPDERDEGGTEPVKVLEVNPSTLAAGVQPVYFIPDVAAGIRYATVIIEVTPEEYEEIRAQRRPLPYDWRLDEELYRRPEAA
jgi:hypothetical protein